MMNYGDIEPALGRSSPSRSFQKTDGSPIQMLHTESGALSTAFSVLDEPLEPAKVISDQHSVRAQGPQGFSHDVHRIIS